MQQTGNTFQGVEFQDEIVPTEVLVITEVEADHNFERQVLSRENENGIMA